MATEIVMPRLSDSMEEGTVLRWLKQVGDEVAVGDELVEIETDKATMTYESDTAGVLIETLAAEGDTLALGAVIAYVGAPGEKPVAATADGGGAASAADQAAPAAGEATPAPDGGAAQAGGAAPAVSVADSGAGNGAAPSRVANRAPGRGGASPVARRVAAEPGVDVRAVQGSGPHGRVVKADVEAAARAAARDGAASSGDGRAAGAAAATAGPAAIASDRAPTAKGAIEVHEPTKIQRTVGRRMAESRATVPDFSLTTTVDMGAALALREELRGLADEGDAVPSVNDLVVKASARALRAQPAANSAWRAERIERYSRVNVGVAVAADGALLVPTLLDADRMTVGEIAAESRRLAGAVRDGSITAAELDGGTFTVSNLGMFGVESFEAVINPPQAAILAVGAVGKRPAVDDEGRLTVRDLMTVTLSCDHRVINGADGARLLAAIRANLEQPLRLAL